MSQSQQIPIRKHRLDERLEGKSITVGQQQTIVPIARLQGLRVSGGHDDSHFGSALLRINPVEIQVNDDGNAYTISIDDPNRTLLFVILIMSILISTICWFIMWRLK